MKSRLKKAYRMKRKKPLFRSRYFRMAVLCVLLLAELYYLFLFSPLFNVKDIKISGNSQLLAESILARIRSDMVECGNNIFRCSPKEMEGGLLSTFPKIKEAKISRNFPGGLEVAIDERSRAAVFCQNQECFNVDQEGIIFEQINEPQKDALVISNQMLLEKLDLGQSALSPKLLSDILKVSSAIGIILQEPAEEFLIVSEQRLNVKTAASWLIYFNLKRDLSWQLQELAVVLKEKIPPQKRRILQYIDLRFDKVFVAPQEAVSD